MRVRDKIAASKRKGMWMDGHPPLGYGLSDRRLVINQAEAETVREIYRRYRKLDCCCSRALTAGTKGTKTRSDGEDMPLCFANDPLSNAAHNHADDSLVSVGGHEDKIDFELFGYRNDQRRRVTRSHYDSVENVGCDMSLCELFELPRGNPFCKDWVRFEQYRLHPWD